MRRYVVGIDLGTSHTVVAYAPMEGGAQGGPAAIELLAIEQLVGPGEVAASPLLPSVRYHAAAGELADADLALPWPQPPADPSGPVVLGRWARQLGAQVPGRLVASAKSWLSHPAVDRQAAILPWGAAPDVPRVSPVAASASYLAHVRAAWNGKFPDSPLEEQELVLTVPASFDEAARALTLEAARQAGLPSLRLLEEPQAAFHDWLFRHRATLAQELAQTRLVLVCDVGGGTTDLSLIRVEWQDGEPRLTRVGVGNHLMLGGDNMDLALAHGLEARLAGDGAARLTAARLSQLVERCRAAKEQLLAADAPAQLPVTLLGGGARLIDGSRSVPLTRDEVERQVVDGFFPAVGPAETARPARGGLVEFGLPYARDPAITRHIADFLRQHAPAVREALGDEGDAGALAVPDALLLNGGVFRAEALAQRLEQALGAWRGAPLRRLRNDQPDLAVARGAVAHALARQGLVPRIGGGSARSYFLLLDAAGTSRGPGAAPQGICILPRGSEPGQEIGLPERSFALRLGRPVRFHLFSAVAEAADQAPARAGDLVTLDPLHFARLPPISTVLQAASGAQAPGAPSPSAASRQELPVRLVAALTEVGTLEMHCVSVSDPGQRWRLEFDLRHQDAGAEPADAPALEAPQASARLAEAVARIDRIFGSHKQKVEPKEVTQLRAQLERGLGDRERWPTSVLRQLFDALWQRERGRRRSAGHERVWLNLVGYTLRPGFGDPLDAWRLQQLWPLFEPGPQHAQDPQVRAQWWTLWRRVAGGLDAAQQQRLLDDFAFNVQRNEQGAAPDAADRDRPPVEGGDEDMLRLGASLERIPADYKAEIGEWLLGRLQPPGGDGHVLWALGRLGAREPVYGSPHDVVPAERAVAWIDALLALDWRRVEPAAFAAVHLARVTDDRSRDLPLALRERIIERLMAINAPPIWIAMVRERVELDEVTERRVLGESLPPGLRLMA